MVLFIAMMFAVFAVITMRDVQTRLIHIGDLLLLCAIRIALLAASSISALAINAEWWGTRALLSSLALAFVLAGAFHLLGRLVSKAAGGPALGKGDTYLLAVCCLFLNPESVEVYFFLVAIFGIVLSLIWLIAKKDKTFPFAPALVWPCWLVLLMT